ncbi:MAG: hypothetical protein JNL43_07050 [Flavobacteriales bacterium]|nr:hypothetical protein [Flavobacteriales bacterium]
MTPALVALFTASIAWSQPMTLVSGDVVVREGTTLRLEGPIVWTLSDGSSVVNDGIIELGEQASIDEPIGGPISGAGTEHAIIEQAPPYTAIEPGGLGLQLTNSNVPAPIEVVRGHLPFALPEGDPSISRWYTIQSADASGASVDISLGYDPTELNGLQAPDLSLFRSQTEVGPWSSLASVVNANTISGSIQYPWGLITAFDANAPTSSPSLVAHSGFHVWPTLALDHLNIVALDGVALEQCEVFDAVGRSAIPTTSGPVGSSLLLDITALAQGSYFLRLNGHAVIKFRKA